MVVAPLGAGAGPETVATGECAISVVERVCACAVCGHRRGRRPRVCSAALAVLSSDGAGGLALGGAGSRDDRPIAVLQLQPCHRTDAHHSGVTSRPTDDGSSLGLALLLPRAIVWLRRHHLRSVCMRSTACASGVATMALVARAAMWPDRRTCTCRGTGVPLPSPHTGAAGRPGPGVAALVQGLWRMPPCLCAPPHTAGGGQRWWRQSWPWPASAVKL